MNFTSADIVRLIAILPNSKAHAIHDPDIAARLNLPTGGNQVEARTLIRYAIQNGHFILSNTRIGYWISNSKQEIQEYIDSLQSRADDTSLRSDELKAAWNLQNPNNQI